MASDGGNGGAVPYPFDAPDSVSAVIAHGLLNSMAVVVGTLTTLADHWPRISEQARQDVLARGIEQAQFVTDNLRDLILGLPLGASSMLEELDEEGQRRRGPRPATEAPQLGDHASRDSQQQRTPGAVVDPRG